MNVRMAPNKYRYMLLVASLLRGIIISSLLTSPCVEAYLSSHSWQAFLVPLIVDN